MVIILINRLVEGQYAREAAWNDAIPLLEPNYPGASSVYIDHVDHGKFTLPGHHKRVH